MSNLLNKINEEIEQIERSCPEWLYADKIVKPLKALKASREFFEWTMEAEYGEDTGEIMQQWDEAVEKELE